MVTIDELEVLLAGDHELRRIELKGSGMLRQNARFVAKVARATMAMGNLRDGGLVVIGIANDQVAAMLPGLNDAELADWSDFDLVTAALGKYSDPPVSFELHKFELSTGARVVVLEVAEFELDIHVCKRDFEGVLQGGQTYVRPRGKPESVPVPSSSEARELHNLAVDKGVRQFVRRAGAAGISLWDVADPADLGASAYANEVRTAWAASTPVTEPNAQALGAWVTTRGFTDVAVRPSTYQADRLTAGQLDQFVAEHAVSMRGWPVPFIDQRQRIQRHGIWIAQDIPSSGMPHGEAWRMFTSGQFLHRRLLATDLRDANELKPTAPDTTGAVAVWDVLLYMVEVAEFGARVATALGLDSVTFDIALEGIAGRQLISGDFWRELHGPYIATADRFEASVTLEVAALLKDPRGVGVVLAQHLLQPFGLDLPDEVLFDWQDEVFRRRR